MGMLAKRLGQGGGWAPWDDRWYARDPNGGATLAGVNVNADSALRLSAVNACIRLLSYTVAMCPWDVFERIGNGRREKAETNGVFTLLHDAPNEYQTPFEFKQGLVSDLARFGNAYTELIYGKRGIAEVLWPISPHCLTVDWYDRKSGRSRIYDVSSAHDGRARVLRDEQVWHPRLMSLDGGLTGASPIRLASEGIGLALGNQIGLARLVKNGMVPAVAYSVEQMLNQKQSDELRNRIKEQLGGVMNWGEPLILGKGAKIEKPGISPRDAQSVELLNWSISDLARIYGIPLVLLQSESKDTSWGTGIEHLKLAYATFTIAPLAVLLEESADLSLILQHRRFFSEFNLDALLRGDLLRRFQAYSIAVNANNPWLKRNDILRRENMQPDESADGERYIVPENNVGVGSHPGTTGVNDQNALHAIGQLNAAVRAMLDEMGIQVKEPENGTDGKVEAAA